jgi:hypothetical protein
MKYYTQILIMALLNTSNKSSMLYLWRLLNDTPFNVPQVMMDNELVEGFQYLDALVDIYTDVLATRFQRMIVNKRAVKENLHENIYVIDTGDENRVMMDLEMTNLGHCVETENDLAMYLRTSYKTLINYTVMFGKNKGRSFRGVLNRKLRDILDKVGGFVQNKVSGKDGTDLFRVYVDVVAEYDILLVQATLVNKH